MKDGLLIGTIVGEMVKNCIKYLNYYDYNTHKISSYQYSSSSNSYLNIDSINPDAYIKITLSP